MKNWPNSFNDRVVLHYHVVLHAGDRLAVWPFDGLERGKYRAVVIDPPWHFRARTALKTRNFQCARDAEKHNPTMGLDDIKALPVRELAHKDGCHLFLWATRPCLPHAFEVITAREVVLDCRFCLSDRLRYFLPGVSKNHPA